MDTIKKSTLRTDVSRKIREAILNNELKPGERIVETRLAKNLGVSQSPVREAIRELELMGLVENKPFLGCFVKKLTPKDVRDTYKVRTYLEMLSVSEATKNITEDQLEKLSKLLKKMRIAAENQLKDEFLELDIEFHQLIIHISNNSLLERMWNMANIGQWTFITAKISKRSLMELADRHDTIYESLKERDEENAMRRIKSHIEELSDEIIMKIESEEAQNLSNF